MIEQKEVPYLRDNSHYEIIINSLIKNKQMTDTSMKDAVEEEGFFPEGYEAPVEISSFMRLEDGDNKFRILSGVVTGWEYWTADKKPVRSKTEWENIPDNIQMRDGKPTAIKYFWSFLVYNYEAEQVQSLEITQKTVMKAMTALIENPAWGNPKGFDITINKTGKELLTKYAVVPNPHSKITDEIQKALDDSTIDLEEIFN